MASFKKGARQGLQLLEQQLLCLTSLPLAPAAGSSRPSGSFLILGAFGSEKAATLTSHPPLVARHPPRVSFGTPLVP